MPICTAGTGGGGCASEFCSTESRELLGEREPHARILDIGCGAGLFFDALEQFGHVEGIESDPIAVEQSGRWRSRIHAGELETFAADRKFDLILALDVVEHVRSPETLLRHAARFLAPDGRMLITTPAFDWLWTSHDRLNHHVKRYTAAEMRTLVRKAGLEPIQSRYLFQSLVVPKLLVRVKRSDAVRSRIGAACSAAGTQSRARDMVSFRECDRRMAAVRQLRHGRCEARAT